MSDTCGLQSFCGRPRGHRGHHGGWRTGVGAVPGVVAQSPVIRDWRRLPQLGLELTPRNLEVIAERIYHGDVSEAAACLGIAEQTFKNHLSLALSRTGAVSTMQLPLLIGWTLIPPGILGRHQSAA